MLYTALNSFQDRLSRHLTRRSTSMPATALPIGTAIGTAHCITGYLGSGGFGHTYLAERLDGKTVALKECFPFEFCRRDGHVVGLKTHDQSQAFTTIQRRFLQEAKMLSEFNHPNIVGGGAVVTANKTIYIEMTHVTGQLLSNRIERWFGKLPLRQSRAIAKDMLSALNHIHTKGYLHKDISPDNIILTPDGTAVLIDLGSTQPMDTLASDDPLLVVKAGYSPQEFYREGAALAAGSDLYQLGATLRHCLTGKRPIESVNRLHARAMGKADPMPALGTKGRACAATFRGSLDQSMAVLLSDRIETADQWANQLETR